MSVSVYVAACREIIDSDLELVKLYNGLIEQGIKPPDELVKKLRSIFGNAAFHPGEPLPMSDPAPGKTRIVEFIVRGEGDVMYGDGKLIQMSDLPPNTVALRIYAEA